MHGFFVFLAFALLGSIGCFLVWQDYLLFRRPRIHCKGAVVGYRKSEDDGSTYFCARIAFADQNGKICEFTDTYGRPKASPGIGAEIKVVYPQGEPQNARVPRPFMRLAIYLFVIGITGLLIANEVGLMHSP